MKLFKKISVLSIVLALVTFAPLALAAQVVSNSGVPSQVQIQYSVNEVLTVTPPAAPLVIPAGTAGPSNPGSFVTTYNLSGGLHTGNPISAASWLSSMTPFTGTAAGVGTVTSSNLSVTVTGAGAASGACANTGPSLGLGVIPNGPAVGSYCTAYSIPFATWSAAPSGTFTQTFTASWLVAPTVAGTYNTTLFYEVWVN